LVCYRRSLWEGQRSQGGGAGVWRELSCSEAPPQSRSRGNGLCRERSDVDRGAGVDYPPRLADLLEGGGDGQDAVKPVRARMLGH